MTNEANAPSASPAVLTRSQAEAEATAAHRARYLAKLTPKIVWFVLPILAICINLRSEEHTSELQSLMRTSYAVFCLKKKQPPHNQKQSKYEKHQPETQKNKTS